jgi:hypothetical protein
MNRVPLWVWLCLLVVAITLIGGVGLSSILKTMQYRAADNKTNGIVASPNEPRDRGQQTLDLINSVRAALAMTTSKQTEDTAYMLTTWFYVNQPPSSFQKDFSSLDQCEAAKQSILIDAKRLADEVQRQNHPTVSASGFTMMSNFVAPTVSVVCVAR